MRPINEQVILITGSTDGLGMMVARDLAERGVTILLHGRNVQKGKAVMKEIREATGNNNISYYNADFNSHENVRRLADEVQTNHDRLDVLINNAGIGGGSPRATRELSKDGYELRFAVNYLAHYLLTYRLLGLLRKSTPARIVNVTSIGQQQIDFDNVTLEKGYDGLRAYRQSKLAQVMFTFDLAEELKGSGVTVNCLHPGTLMNTKMVLNSGYFRGSMTRVEQGADAVEYLATSPELDNVTGEYFDGKHRSRANSQAYDRHARQRLKRMTEQLTGLPAETSPQAK